MTASLSSRIRPFDETVVFAAVDDLHGGNDRSDVAIDLQVGGGHLNVPKMGRPENLPTVDLAEAKLRRQPELRCSALDFSSQL
ncbi:hypothetical protein EN786_36275 [Mesorhizobium sp. M4B.F.Ca.ET.143.01.1.1]|nr:hypothetical protein EN786_36275 [Mesorhizobium sp. M4B.F.Ca.ET.143.01.1.1]